MVQTTHAWSVLIAVHAMIGTSLGLWGAFIGVVAIGLAMVAGITRAVARSPSVAAGA